MTSKLIQQLHATLPPLNMEDDRNDDDIHPDEDNDEDYRSYPPRNGTIECKELLVLTGCCEDYYCNHHNENHVDIQHDEDRNSKDIPMYLFPMFFSQYACKPHQLLFDHLMDVDFDSIRDKIREVCNTRTEQNDVGLFSFRHIQCWGEILHENQSIEMLTMH
jgi:hypothetical protein